MTGFNVENEVNANPGFPKKHRKNGALILPVYGIQFLKKPLMNGNQRLVLSGWKKKIFFSIDLSSAGSNIT